MIVTEGSVNNGVCVYTLTIRTYVACGDFTTTLQPTNGTYVGEMINVNDKSSYGISIEYNNNNNILVYIQNFGKLNFYSYNSQNENYYEAVGYLLNNENINFGDIILRQLKSATILNGVLYDSSNNIYQINASNVDSNINKYY